MSRAEQKKPGPTARRVREKIPPVKSRAGIQRQQSIYTGVALALILAFVALVRIRLAPVPLERDEGEYAYAGQLMLQGVLPFVEVYNMKMPGIYAAYAAILAVFGQTHVGVHLGFLLVNLATIVLLFFLARRVRESPVALLAAGAYGMLSLGEQMFGAFAHATHFVAFFALGGLLVLPGPGDSRAGLRLIAGGLLLGVAFLMKQHGAAFVAFAGVCVVRFAMMDATLSPGSRAVRVVAFAAAALAPFLATCATMAGSGVFDRFWFWTFTYAKDYVTQVPMWRAPAVLARTLWTIVPEGAGIWALAIAGIIASPVKKSGRNLLLATFFVFSFLATCPGFYFREHYFVLLLPALSIYAAVGAFEVGRLLREKAGLRKANGPVMMAIACGFAVVAQWGYLFVRSPDEISRTLYGLNPFVESIPIAAYIREHTSLEDTIAVIGSEPQIPFYAGRRSASGFCYLYPLMENHPNAEAMQEQMIAEIEAASAKYTVLVMQRSSWQMSEKSPTRFAQWVNGYLEQHYVQVGLIDLIAKTQIYSYWDQAARDRKPRIAFSWIGVFVRREGSDASPADAGT